MTNTSPRVYDPDKVGPADRCLRCWLPHGDRVNYCENCGKIGPAAHYWDFDHTYHCVNHPKVQTREFCGLCAEPGCNNCQERRTEPLSGTYTVVLHLRSNRWRNGAAIPTEARHVWGVRKARESTLALCL